MEGCDDRLEQELADERRENRESLTARESREEGLIAQLSASEKQLSEKERIVEQLSAERTSLTDKVILLCTCTAPYILMPVDPSGCINLMGC